MGGSRDCTGTDLVFVTEAASNGFAQYGGRMNIFAIEYAYGSQASLTRDEHRPAHRSWLHQQAGEGRVLSAGAYTDGTGALLVLQAESEEDVREILEQDPFAIEGGIAGVRITQWKPVIGAFADTV